MEETMSLSSELQDASSDAQRKQEERKRQEQKNHEILEHTIMLRRIEEIQRHMKVRADQGYSHIVVELEYDFRGCTERFGSEAVRELVNWAHAQGFQTKEDWCNGTQFTPGCRILYIMW